MTSDNKDGSRFAILLDGPVSPTSRLINQLQSRRVIAADGGMRHVQPLGLDAELWVGDFDSASKELQADFPSMKRSQFTPEKARSDGELAIEHALALGATDILVCGATGGPRSDHVLFNLALIATVGLDAGCSLWAANGTEEHHVMLGGQSRAFDYPDGTVFSVFPIGNAEGLTIEGAHWPLDKLSLKFGSTHTLSNRVHARLRIDLESGMVFVIAQLEPS